MPRSRRNDVDPARELHRGRRRVNSRIKRPDTRQHLDDALNRSQNLLASAGASTHATFAARPTRRFVAWAGAPSREIAERTH